MKILFISFVVFYCAFISSLSQAKIKNSQDFFQNLTGDDEQTERSRWDNLYRRNKGYVFGKNPVQFLAEHIQLLPIGKALDIAMGEGRNAVFLAKKGFDVEGVDISEVAVRKAKRLALENGVRIRTVTADLNKYEIPKESFDLIIVFYYLQRNLIPQIRQGLKPGGIVVFENYTQDHIKYDKTQNPEYLLAKEELKKFFEGFEILKYREKDDGSKALASIIAKKKLK